MDLSEDRLQRQVEAGNEVYIWRLDCFLIGIPEPQCILLFNKPDFESLTEKNLVTLANSCLVFVKL